MDENTTTHWSKQGLVKVEWAIEGLPHQESGVEG